MLKQSAPGGKKAKIRYQRTTLRKSVFINLIFVFIPGMLVWALLSKDDDVFKLSFNFWYHFLIAMVLFIFAIVISLVFIFIKFAQPDQLLYCSTLMAVLMSFYLTSFAGWSFIIRLLMGIAILLIVAFLTNGISNWWSDKIKRESLLKRLKKLNQNIHIGNEINLKKIDPDLLDFFGIKLEKILAHPGGQGKLQIDKLDKDDKQQDITLELDKELEQLREIKLDD